MQFNVLSAEHTVSPQITGDDVAAIAAAGYKSVICNRPDSENPPNLHLEHIEKQVTAAGLVFAAHPFSSGAFTMDVIQRQADLIADLPTPIFSYCASGTRCCLVWSFVQAKDGKPVSEIMQAAQNAGYNVSHLRHTFVQLGAMED